MRLPLMNIALLGSIVTLMAVPQHHAIGDTAVPQYKQVGKIAIGGDGGWDYLTVDSDAHRLYITRGTRVMVVDTVANKIVGDIPNTPGVHGIALASKLNRGFASNGRANSILIFDLKTLKEISRVPVGTNPDAILYDSFTNRVFTFNGSSNDISAVDASTGKVLGTIPVGGKPEFAVTDEKGMIFCNVEDKSEILAIDPKALTVKHHWPIAPTEEPSGLAFDKKNRRLFAVGSNKKMAILDADTGKVLASPEIGNGPDAAGFDPMVSIAVSSNGQDGSLTVVHEINKNSFKVAATVQTQKGARTMALDPKTHKIYLITASYKAATAGERRPQMEPNSAVILIYGPSK